MERQTRLFQIRWLLIAFVAGVFTTACSDYDTFLQGTDRVDSSNSSSSDNSSSSEPEVVAKPVISPASGTYSGQIEITITASPGAEIHYTTDGSEPNETSGVYTSPVTVSENHSAVTIKAIALKSGVESNGISEAAYEIIYEVYTVAGKANEAGSANGNALEATFNQPNDVAVAGNFVYVADRNNHVIRKIDLQSNLVTVLAGSSGTTGSQDGNLLDARFNKPHSIVVDGSVIYVSDTYNHTIRKIELTETGGTVSTLAGSAGTEGSTDGTTGTSFKFPRGIAVDNAYIYVADRENHPIRRVQKSDGAVVTLAGSGTAGYQDGNGTTAKFNSPNDIAVLDGSLFIMDTYNHRIRKLQLSDNTVTTLAGQSTKGSADGSGSSAQFNFPYGIVAHAGDLIVADTANSTLRRIVVSSAEVTTLAGLAGTSGYADGSYSEARFSTEIQGLASDGTILYVADSDSHIIRAIR